MRFRLAWFVACLQIARTQGSGAPLVEFALGAFGAFNADLRRVTIFVAADLDYRKNFEPSLVERFGPPILPIPNSSFYPGLRVRPVMAEDNSQDTTAVGAVTNFMFGANGYPKVNGVMGPFGSVTGVSTGACTGAFKLNQICLSVQAEDVGDKTRFPYFFRYTVPSTVQGQVMWAYVVFFRFRTLTILITASSAPVAQRDGVLNAAAAAQRYEAITSLSVPESSADSDADHAAWDGAIELVRSARNRLVLLIPSLNMFKLVLGYMPLHGLSAPHFQLLLGNQINSMSKWNVGMSRAHGLTIRKTVDPSFSALMHMLMSMNETDILNATHRYGLESWFDPARISECMIKSVPPLEQFDSLSRGFNAFYMFVRAFGELLNQGVAPEAVGGDRLRAQMATSDFAGVLMRASFNSNLDAILDMNVVSLYVNVDAAGKLVQSSTQVAASKKEQALDGTLPYSLSLLAPPLWATGDVAASAPSELLACPPGQRLAMKGIGVGNGPGICQACELGTFTNASDQTECTKCPPGTFGIENLTSCAVCPMGWYASDKAATTCMSCMQGSVAQAVGSTGCELCPLGTYAESLQGGAARCTPCDAGLTTVSMASLSVTACVCAEGSYRPLGSTVCTPCSEGLYCPVGSDEANRPENLGRRLGTTWAPYPQVVPGYFVTKGDPHSVYKCDSALFCLGGPPESCATGHRGMVCADCAEGYARSARGTCKLCSSGDKVPVVLTSVAAVVGVTALTVYSLHDEGNARLTMVTAVLAAGQLIGCVQALSVIQQVKVVWSDPLTLLWQLTGFLSFDLDVLKVQCILRSDRPVSNFLLQLFSLPVVAAVLAITMLTVTQCRRFRDQPGAQKRKCSTDRYLNLLGLMFVMTYISITVAMLRPLICRTHPNELRSMVSRASVICWRTAEHRGLVTLSIIGVLIYPVGLLATVARGTLLYPYKAASGSLSHLCRFRFIFARFRPDCYYWGFWYLSRNLALSLVPVVATDSGTFQMMALCAILLPFVCVESFLVPWRTRLANLSELCSVVGLLFFLQAAAFLVGAQTGGSATLVSTLLFAIVIISLAGVALVVAYALLRTCSPGTQYGAFLCHHKEGGGSLARWFKLQASMVSKAPVFLDSDQLEELDLLVDTVRCRTRSLLVLLTSQTLARIWCAAEVTSAVLHKVRIVPVACSDYRGCTEEFLDKLDAIWSETQKHSVAQYGITMEHIRRAFEHFATLDAVHLGRFGPIQEQRAAAFKALHLCGLGTGAVPKGEDAHSDARIVIAGASGDAEARTTCEVLRLLVQTRVEVVVAAVHSGAQAESHALSCAYLVVVLTRGLLQDESFLEVGLALDGVDRGSPVEIVTALADTNFAFPGTEFFEAMEKEGDKERFVAFLRRTFNTLALPFSPHGSEGIMGAQVDELCQRRGFQAENLARISMSNRPSIDTQPSVRISDGTRAVTGVLAATGFLVPSVDHAATASITSAVSSMEADASSMACIDSTAGLLDSKCVDGHAHSEEAPTSIEADVVLGGSDDGDEWLDHEHFVFNEPMGAAV